MVCRSVVSRGMQTGAQQNYQMSRFLLCYLVYSFLHACFLLGRFIFLRSRQARWTEGFTLVFMVSKKLLPLFIFHIAPRVMNNSGYMFCFVFQEGPFCFSRGGPLLFHPVSLHYLGCFLKSYTCHEQFWIHALFGFSRGPFCFSIGPPFVFIQFPYII